MASNQAKSKNQKKCKLCGDPTDVGFNIKLKLVPVCEPCADSITLQQISYVFKNKEQ